MSYTTRDEKRQLYNEIKSRYPKRMPTYQLLPLFDEVYDDLPEEFPPDAQLVKVSKLIGVRCTVCHKIHLISPKHAGRDVWVPLSKGIEPVCIHCNRHTQTMKGLHKIQQLLKVIDEESLKFQEQHKKQWHEVSIQGGRATARYFDPLDELYHTEIGQQLRQHWLELKRGTKSEHVEREMYKGRKLDKNYVELREQREQERFKQLIKQWQNQEFSPKLGLSFLREQFYNEQLNIVEVHSIDKVLQYKDLIEFKHVPGVCEIEDLQGLCLNVGETKHLGVELTLMFRQLQRVRDNEKSIQEKLWLSKYQELISHEELAGGLVVKLVSVGVEDKKKTRYRNAICTLL